ncbi:DEAD/DEAH box helicase [Sanguibacter sp. Leaf3]|uniref:DEAD/DEAH box helicase n=1 Tax=Sanguibacter sp. Leaf3 TaxID=1736209 RepID=UPI00138F399B|nr:DEAD/DEAH box helicase [Sanguibacter sp. Leaf3]
MNELRIADPTLQDGVRMLEPEMLLLLAVGTLGDAAFEINEKSQLSSELQKDLEFSASFFDALIASRIIPETEDEILLLASCSYYLVDRPGSSLVMSKLRRNVETGTELERLLDWLLFDATEEWSESQTGERSLIGSVADATREHFLNGGDASEAISFAMDLRRRTYEGSSARELLLSDLVLAVLQKRFATSTWMTLPLASGLTKEDWRSILPDPGFPKQLWPAQLEIGRQGVFRGQSAVVQMPTSSGKTRSLEIIIRSGVLSGRIRVAVIVAPFRALSHEIASSLRASFRPSSRIAVNELSDLLQDDFSYELARLVAQLDSSKAIASILVLTPEKLQYVLRHNEALMRRIDLLVYDEAHQFDSGQRGVVYELLVTEIRDLLPDQAQTVAISAVMPNADDLSRWLLGDSSRVVDGSGLAPTARATAFAGWLEGEGQLEFYESLEFQRPDYSLGKVMDVVSLGKLGSERTIRRFPDLSKQLIVSDTAISLGLRFVNRGSVAIFAGTKATAAKIVRRVLEVFDRGLAIDSPAEFSDGKEVEAVAYLTELHFGERDYASRAAQLGVFAHHGNTPNGLRVAIEHAMQRELIRFVVCTSTLAQGVNLPIRYLIVSGTRQGKGQMSVRDFQNLLGRAGRAGMHTEGLVVFADPKAHSGHTGNRWKNSSEVRLLDPKNSEPMSSSILGLVKPFSSITMRQDSSAVDIVQVLFAYRRGLVDRSTIGSDALKELEERQAMVAVVESYLMASRSDVPFDSFRAHVVTLSRGTFAYDIASESEKQALEQLFLLAAEDLEAQVPELEKQTAFSRTLLGAREANYVYQWVQSNRSMLLEAQTPASILKLVWPLFAATTHTLSFQNVEPGEGLMALSVAWVEGRNYESIFELSSSLELTKPYGDKRQRLSTADITKFLHSTLSFDFTLVLSAVIQFLGDSEVLPENPLSLTLSAMRYGVPDPLAVSVYDSGVPDRAVAVIISQKLRADGYDGLSFREARVAHWGAIEDFVALLPECFRISFRSSDGPEAWEFRG